MDLLEKWAAVYDQMQRETEKQRLAVEGAVKVLDYLEAPFRRELAALEAEIQVEAEKQKASYRGTSAGWKYRKGSYRVTYDWRTVDAVRDTLRDTMPSTAKTLDEARKESVGQPSVTVYRVVEDA